MARRAQFTRLVVSSSMVVYGDGAYACPAHGTVRGRAPRSAARRASVGAHLPELRGGGRPAGDVGRPPAPPHEHVRRLEARPGGAFARHRPRVPAADACPALPQHLRIAPGAVEPVHGGVRDHGRRACSTESRPRSSRTAGSFAISRTSPTSCARTSRPRRRPEEALYLPYNVGTGRMRACRSTSRARSPAASECDIEPQVTGEFREGDIRHCFADVSRARRLLGWEARVTFDEGVGRARGMGGRRAARRSNRGGQRRAAREAESFAESTSSQRPGVARDEGVPGDRAGDLEGGPQRPTQRPRDLRHAGTARAARDLHLGDAEPMPVRAEEHLDAVAHARCRTARGARARRR